jgi:hypothetical protein
MSDKPVYIQDILKKLPASRIARIDKRAAEIVAEIDAPKRPSQKPVKGPAFKP